MKRAWIIVILALVITGVVAAQDSNDATLVAFFNDQLYKLEGDALVAYDACMPDEDLNIQFVASPDGTKFAFATLPKIISAAIDEFGGLGDMPISLNLWYCDMTTDTLTRFFAGADSDEPFTGDLPEASPINSIPVWSPDGTQLAWSSASVDGLEYQLHIYNLEDASLTEYLIDYRHPSCSRFRHVCFGVMRISI